MARAAAFLAERPPHIRRGLLFGIALGVLAGGYFLYQWLTHVQETDAQTAGEEMSLASRVDGWMLARPVIEGDNVKKGQILAQLDCRDAKLRLAAMQANIAATDAAIREAKIKRDTADKTTRMQVADARAEVTAAIATAAVSKQQEEIAQSDYRRAQTLIDAKAVSKESWEHNRSTYLQSVASLREARAQVAVKQADLNEAMAQLGQIPMLEQEIETLIKQRAVYQAQADQIRQEIADRTLRAPFNGVIDRTFIHPGDYVQAGQWLMMMHNPKNVWVEAIIKETKIARLHVGQPADIRVDAYPDVRFRGHIVRVGNAATNQFALLPTPNPSGNFTKITQRVPVRIAIDHPPRLLQPGLMTEVSIDVAH